MSTDFTQDFVYNLGVSIFYICEDGDVPSEDRVYFFDDDMNRSNLSITCLDNGTWTEYPNIICANKNGNVSSYTSEEN